MRVILLDCIFENKEDMFSLLTEDSENYAFSDQQMQRIEENLLLRSVDELPEISQKTIKEIEEPDPFVRTLLEEPDTYELWNSVDRQKKENQPDTILNLEELQHYIGIHTFFQYQQEQEEKEEQSKKDSTDFYKVIEELKKKNKKDKPLSYGNNSGNSYILNNR